MKKFYKKPVMVTVVWNDTRSTDDEFTLNEAELSTVMHPMRVETVGWLVAEDDGGYLIAEEMQTSPDIEMQVRRATYIIKSGVIEVRKQRAPRKKKVESVTAEA